LILEIIFVAVLGISIGSFLNVVIYRVPKGKSIILPSSHCPKCQVKLKFYHNIPIFSWFFLRGRCSFCNSQISIQYPIIEAITGLIFVTLYFKYGISYELLLVSAIFSVLLALSIIDLKYKAVPDSLNLLALTLAIIYPLEITAILQNLEQALIFGGAFAFLRFYVSYFVGREAMGEGDIMIAGTIGAILGIYLGTFTIFLSSILTIPAILIFKEREMPFIPFLALALWIVFISESTVIQILNSIFNII